MKLRIVVIIPTYNERENITQLLHELDLVGKTASKYTWIVLVVDDNSPDHTAEYVKNFQPKHVQIKLLLGQKQGLGVAIIRGIKYASTTLKANMVITNEADFAYKTSYLIDIANKLNSGFDVVLTSRHANKGNIEGWNFDRKINHFIANKIFAGFVAGQSHIQDHNGLLRGMKVKGVIDKINWDRIPYTGFGFINYWCFLLTQKTNKIYQLPIVYKFRTQGESKVTFNKKYLKTYLHDVSEYILICIKIRFNHERS